MNNIVKKVAAIHDISGIGRCSLTIAIPIISALGSQCCPFPTAILSSQTAYNEFSFLDLTEEMKNYKSKWERMNIKFDCIYSGFLGSKEQIDIVIDFIKNNRKSLIVIDPVMGDDGEIYSTYTLEMCKKIKELITYADVITPNLTEAFILLDREYNSENISREILKDLAKTLAKKGPNTVIITGIVKDNELWNYAYNKIYDEECLVKSKLYDNYYGGTGDTFASILIGMILKGMTLNESIQKASDFICKAIEFTSKHNSDPREGIMFEPLLGELIL